MAAGTVKERPAAQRRDIAARTRLAEAIAAHAEAQSARTEAEAAYKSCDAATLAAVATTGETERALRAAQQQASFNGPDHAGLWAFRVEEAHTAHAAAEAVVTQARAAAFAAEERVAEAEQRSAIAVAHVKQGALAVLRAEATASAPTLAAEAKEALLDFATRAAALAWLARHDVIAPTDPQFRGLLEFFRHAGGFDINRLPEVSRVPGAAPWELALSILERDADADLPG